MDNDKKLLMQLLLDLNDVDKTLDCLKNVPEQDISFNGEYNTSNDGRGLDLRVYFNMSINDLKSYLVSRKAILEKEIDIILEKK